MVRYSHLIPQDYISLGQYTKINHIRYQQFTAIQSQNLKQTNIALDPLFPVASLLYEKRRCRMVVHLIVRRRKRTFLYEMGE